MELHILKLLRGMSTIVKHDNGRTSMIDICAGHINAPYGYDHPINYLLDMPTKGLARFILTCPKEEYMDGLDSLHRELGFRNFWHSGVFIDKWIATSPNNEKDYNLYRDIILGRYIDSCHSIRVETGYVSPYTNFEVLSPSQGLMATDGLDANDASIVLLIKSTCGQKILVAGDVGRRVFLEMTSNSTVRSKMDNIDILVVRSNDVVVKSLDIIKEVVKPKVIVYGGYNIDIVESSSLSGILQINVKDFGTVVIDDVFGRFSIYTANARNDYGNKYNRDVRKHKIYNVTNIIDL